MLSPCAGEHPCYIVVIVGIERFRVRKRRSFRIDHKSSCIQSMRDRPTAAVAIFKPGPASKNKQVSVDGGYAKDLPEDFPEAHFCPGPYRIQQVRSTNTSAGQVAQTE